MFRMWVITRMKAGMKNVKQIKRTTTLRLPSESVISGRQDLGTMENDEDAPLIRSTSMDSTTSPEENECFRALFKNIDATPRKMRRFVNV